MREALAIYRRLGDDRGEADTCVLPADLATSARRMEAAAFRKESDALFAQSQGPG